MDNQTAKEVLSAYRPDGTDGEDPIFEEALRHCQRDPEMREWLRKERAYDRNVAKALRDIPVPQDAKKHLIHTASAIMKEEGKDSSSHRLFHSSLWAIAAVLVLTLLVLQSIFRPDSFEVDPETFTLAGLVTQAMPLSYQSDNPEDVIAWLREKKAPVPGELPSNLDLSSVLGCRLFTLPKGGQISLLCMMKNGELVHYFIFNEKAKSLMAYAPENTWWEENGWNMYTFSSGSQQIALATQGSTRSLL